jgi:DNA-binding LacI/PurR family transcriptional regulator
MNPPVTMRQIAERAKVSIDTVSHVMNDTAGGSREASAAGTKRD